MAEISTNSGKINVSAGQNTVNVGVTKDYSQYYSQLSKDWATKTDGLVNNEDYSSKYYAEKSKDWATDSENNLNAVISQHEQITSEITQAREDISTDLSGALLDIETSKNAGLTAIDNAKTNGVTAVNTTKDDSVTAVQKAQTTAETSIKSLQTSAEKSVTTGIANIETSKKNAISDITTAGTEQVANIKQTGFYMQDDKLYYINSDGETKEFKSGSVTAVFDVVEKDHVLTYEESKGLAQLGTYVYKTAVAGSRYGYPDFYNQCVKEKNAGISTQTQLGSNTVTLYKNDNGHIFYDIADKDAIDAWYNIYGVAWYYGVDTANERIFLPYPDKTVLNRKLVKHVIDGTAGYDLYADGWKKEWGRTHVGGKSSSTITFKIPFANENYSGIASKNELTNQTAANSTNGGVYNLKPTYMQLGQAEGGYTYGWIAEGQTNVITDVKANKYFYMCVGNTDVESAITDVIDITTSENDTIPLGWSTYQSGGTPTSAFLASLGQWNSGTLYSTFYNEFVKKIGQAFGAGYVKAHTASDITDYDLVINQDDQTFRLPLKNGSELIADNSSDKITSQLFNSTHPYTATERVFVTGNFYSTGATASEAFINGVRIASEASGYGSFQVILNKGDVLTTTAVATDNWAKINIAPVIGNGTLYYKVSNAVQNLQLMDVAEISEELANKVDNSNTQWATNACMPDYSAGISVTYPLSSKPYTAPCNGMLCPWGRPSNTAIRPIINGVKQEYLRLGELSGGSGGFQGRSYVLSKGDVIYFDTSYDRLDGCVFYPLKGAK